MRSEQFVAECEAAGMRVLKFEAIVLHQKKAECTLRVEDESLPEMVQGTRVQSSGSLVYK